MTRTRFRVSVELGGETVSMAEVDAEERRGQPVRTDLTYDRSYLARPMKLAVDPMTPLATARHVSTELPRGLTDASADGWGRRLLLRANRGRELGETDFLLGVPDSARIGAMRFEVDEQSGFVATDQTHPALALGDLAHAASVVEDDPDDLAAVRRLLDAGSAGLGGVRPKASLADGDRLRIAKFPSATDEIEVVAWEMLWLDLAGRAGIPVPARMLVDVGQVRVLVLDRFDRSATGARVPYLSAFSLTGAIDADGGDYVEIGEALSELDTADLSLTLRDLWLRALFNVAMRNTDDHLRNHAMLWSPAGWALSPAFDLTPNPIGGSARATSIDGDDTPAREARGLRRLAESFGISSEETTALFQRMAAATSSWQSEAERLALRSSETARLEPSISEAHLRLAAEFD